MPLSNQEKSAMREESMNKIAEQIAMENKDFRHFLIIRGDPHSKSYPPTWRRLATWLKQQVEAGQRVRIVIESGSGGS